jgi:hypothetical protein
MVSRRPSPSNRRRPRRAAARWHAPGGHAGLLLLLLSAGCGVLSPEEQLLTRFFEASRLNDTTQAAKYATVTFNPRAEGVVEAFEIAELARVDQQTRVVIDAAVRPLGGVPARRQIVATIQQRDGRPMIVDIR